MNTSCEICLTFGPQNPVDEKSTLVQVMAWCHQATSHYLSQCWPRSMPPYGITRPQWVNDMYPRNNGNGPSCPVGYCWHYFAGTLPTLSSHCRLSFENRVPIDFIYMYPIFNWTAVGSLNEWVPVDELSNGHLDHVNSLWPNDAKWQQRSMSTLAQVGACYHMTPSHHLNQCWFTISKVQE